MQSIKKIIKAEPFCLTLEFDKNEVCQVDLEEKFVEWSKTPESKFKELLNPEQFKKIKLNKEIETIYWENGIDLCPDFLYDLGKKI